MKPDWASFIATAKVKSTADATFGRRNRIRADRDAGTSAGAFKATEDEASGILRARVLPGLPFSEDFESFDINEAYPAAHVQAGTAFAYPPLPWIGARFKWDIREMDGSKVLVKTLDNVLFQRATSFIGHPDASNYTVEADVMTDGNRRMKSTVGVINQRYVIALIGNWQELEVSSNHDRIKVSVPFKWSTKMVSFEIARRCRQRWKWCGPSEAWPRDEEEPSSWTIECPIKSLTPKSSRFVWLFTPIQIQRLCGQHFRLLELIPFFNHSIYKAYAHCEYYPSADPRSPSPFQQPLWLRIGISGDARRTTTSTVLKRESLMSSLPVISSLAPRKWISARPKMSNGSQNWAHRPTGMSPFPTVRSTLEPTTSR